VNGAYYLLLARSCPVLTFGAADPGTVAAHPGV